MRAAHKQIALLALLAGTAGERCALAGPNDGGSAAPQAYQKPAGAPTDVFQDPAVMHPKEPIVNCDVAESNDPRRPRSVQRIECLPQADALKRAAQAASYLAIYQHSELSQFGAQMKNPARRAEIKSAVAACLNNDPKCDPSVGSDDERARARKMQSDLLQSLVQYNFGKDLRRQVLEGQTRAENMKSMPLSREEQRDRGIREQRVLSSNGRTRSGSVLESTFLVDPHSPSLAFDLSKLTSSERASLGAEFNRTFDSFVNEYSSSTGQRGPKSRWHYVAAKNSANGNLTYVNAVDYRNLNPLEGKSAIDKARLDNDVRTQEASRVKEIVGAYQENFRDTLAKPKVEIKVIDRSKSADQQIKIETDSMGEAYKTAGFGVSRDLVDNYKTKGGNAQDAAAAVAVSINKVIVEKEREIRQRNAGRLPSSGARTPLKPSVMVDVDAFDKFLDDIWPGGTPKPAK